MKEACGEDRTDCRGCSSTACPFNRGDPRFAAMLEDIKATKPLAAGEVWRHFFEGMSLDQIARAYNVTREECEKALRKHGNRIATRMRR